MRLSDSSGFEAAIKTESGSNMILGDDLRLQCDEDLMGECTVEVKDIHIQGEQNKNKKKYTPKMQNIIEKLNMYQI